MIVAGDALPTGHWGGTVWGGNPAVTAGPTPDIARDVEGIASVKNLAITLVREHRLLTVKEEHSCVIILQHS